MKISKEKVLKYSVKFPQVDGGTKYYISFGSKPLELLASSEEELFKQLEFIVSDVEKICE